MRHYYFAGKFIHARTQPLSSLTLTLKKIWPIFIHTYVRALKLTFDFLLLWFHHRWTFFLGYAFAGVVAAWTDADDCYHVLRYHLLSQLTSIQEKREEK